MRRKNRREVRNNAFDYRKVLYLSGSILAIAIIAFVVTFLIYGNKLENNTNLAKLNTSIIDNYTDNTEETSSQFGKTVNEMEMSSEDTNEMTNEINTTKYAINTSAVDSNSSNTKISSNNITKQNTSSNNVEVNNSKVETKTTEKKTEDPKFIKPVTGEILKEFAKDKLVYSNTLKEWVTHNGIDIKAKKTTVIKASAEGTVKSIKNDPRYGLTVVIEHANGFTSVYANLVTAEFVVEGEKIKQGQTIGTVGNTATFEIADEAHLHFEILKDGEYLDPELYIKD